MLFNATPMPTLPTTDLDRSRAFCGGVMGFTPADLEIPGGISYRCGDGMFGVFVTFQAEGLGWEDGVAVMADVRSAWFRDPDGNTLNISEAPE